LIQDPDDDLFAFEELFAVTVQLLDRVWVRRRANYMQFQAVMKEVRGRVERAVGNRRVRSLGDLAAALEEA
jgi:hypothetical protein